MHRDIYLQECFGVKDLHLISSTTKIIFAKKRGQPQSYDPLKDPKVEKKTVLEYELVYDGEIPEFCPKCNIELNKYGTRDIRIAATPNLGHITSLHITYPRRRCPHCHRMWQPKLEGVDGSRRVTEAAFADIAQRSLYLTFRDVAREYPITHATVKNIFEGYVSLYRKHLQFKVPTFLGIDEKYFQRIGFVTVITDLEHRTVFDLIEGRTEEVLDEYFKNLPGRENIQWVCSDMYRFFWKSIARHTFNATWVIDHFHVVKAANEAVDAVRKALQETKDKQGRLTLKKGYAGALRRRTKDMGPEEAATIRAIRCDANLKDLITAFDLKEDFYDIYDLNPNSREDAQAAFELWENSIPSDEIFEPFRKLAGTVHHYYDYIFNWWICPVRISNGYTECANRLINEIDLKGRGYSFEVLRARTLYRKQNLEKIIASNGATIGPRIDIAGSLFMTEPDSSIKVTDTGCAVDAETGEIIYDAHQK